MLQEFIAVSTSQHSFEFSSGEMRDYLNVIRKGRLLHFVEWLAVTDLRSYNVGVDKVGGWIGS